MLHIICSMHFVIYKVDGADDGSLVVLIWQMLLMEGLPYMPSLKELHVLAWLHHAHHCLVPVTSIISSSDVHVRGWYIISINSKVSSNNIL